MKTKPVLFSDLIKVDKSVLAELGVFNPLLNFDTKLFVEPLLLKDSSSPIIRESFCNYNKFFVDVMLLLQTSKKAGDICWRQAQRLVRFPEYKYTCIGYGSSSIDGSGSGVKLNSQILDTAKEIVDFAREQADIFILLPLLEEGIGADIISDMTQNIIDDDICQYTTFIMEKLNIKGEKRYKSRTGQHYTLPYNPYHKCPVKLLPLDILSNLPMADSFDSWLVDAADENSNLRDLVNRHIGQAWFEANKSHKKETILDLLKKDKEFFLVILKTLQECSFDHYDLEKDYAGLYRWLDDSKKYIQLKPNADKKQAGDSLEAIYDEIEKITLYFHELVETQDLRRIFWTEHKSKLRHVKEFYSQMLFNMASDIWLSSRESNINIERQVNKETKHLEFRFSISGKYSVIVEVKHANNNGLHNGYLAQSEVCQRKHKSVKGVYIVMDFSDKPSNQLEAIKKVETEHSKIFEIDTGSSEMNVTHNFDSPDLELPFVEFEGMDFIDDRYKDEKSKGGLNRHKNTNVIKLNVVKPIFMAKRQVSPKRKVSEIYSSIIKELNAIEGLDSEDGKVKKFMDTYSFNSFEEISLTEQYLKEHNDGGQIQEWCYQISQGKL